jgi:hypothetical protein
MSQIIIFKNENGGVSVTIPTPEVLESHGIEWIKNKDTPANSIIVEKDSLPNNDNDFFDSWEMDDEGNITVNLSKAKEHTKVRLRVERTPLLSTQDVLFQRALENGDDTTAIVAEKNRLRDITLLADAATTLEELRNIHC